MSEKPNIDQLIDSLKRNPSITMGYGDISLRAIEYINELRQEVERLRACLSNINYHTTIMAEVINTRTFTPEEFVMSFSNLGIAVDDAYISIAPHIEGKL